MSSELKLYDKQKGRVTKLVGVLGASENRKGTVHESTVTAARSTQQRNPSKSKGSVSSSARKQDLAVRRPFAVFDIDGTLIRWQLYHAIADELGHQGYIDQKAYVDIKHARLAWKRREHQEAFKDYESQVVRSFDTAIKSVGVEQFDKAVHKTFSEYKDQIYTYTRELIKELKAKDYVLFAISGSPEEAVKLIAKHYGFDDFVGSRYTRKDGSFSGEKFVAALDKKAVLNGLIKKHKLDFKGSIAVGDSESDISILEMVENPIAFNPSAQLYEHARKHSWKIVVERKNVIFELEPKSGTYQLKV